MANQGSAKQDRPTEQSVPTRRTRQGGEMSRWDRDTSGPFAWMRQMQDQLDRAFSSVWSGGGTTPARATGNVIGPSEWSPANGGFQRGHGLVVPADVPGPSKDDITVDIADDQLTIRREGR